MSEVMTEVFFWIGVASSGLLTLLGIAAFSMWIMGIIWGAFFAPRERPAIKVGADSRALLIFQKGTVVKMGGIPCELLQDTPFYSEHYLAMMKDEGKVCREEESP